MSYTKNKTYWYVNSENILKVKFVKKIDNSVFYTYVWHVTNEENKNEEIMLYGNEDYLECIYDSFLEAKTAVSLEIINVALEKLQKLHRIKPD